MHWVFSKVYEPINILSISFISWYPLMISSYQSIISLYLLLSPIICVINSLGCLLLADRTGRPPRVFFSLWGVVVFIFSSLKMKTIDFSSFFLKRVNCSHVWSALSDLRRVKIFWVILDKNFENIIRKMRTCDRYFEELIKSKIGSNLVESILLSFIEY